MARSNTHTKTIAITPAQHAQLKKLQTVYKVRILADVLDILFYKKMPGDEPGNELKR